MPTRISQKPYGIVILSTFMQSFVHELFPGMKITGCYQFRVTRNSDLFVSDDDISDLKESLKGELSTRHLGDAVRLEISSDIPDHLLKYLRKSCDLNSEDCYRVDGPVNLMRLMQVAEIVNRPDLKFPSHTPKLPLIKGSIFDELKTRDVLLHHPYESFEPVLNLLRTASKDPDVLAIKQTIYRTGNVSPVMDALIEAAKNGKEVTVIVELLARFDEETNISWAAKLEEVGAHVVYGVVKHKCHAKMIMIVRKELLPAKGKMINAIKLASEFVASLPKEGWSPETTEKRQGFVHPTSIEGALEKASVQLILRDHDTTLMQSYPEKLRAIAQQVVAAHPGARFELQVQEQYRNMKEILKDVPFVADYAELAMQKAGLTPKRAIIRGGTDGSRLSFMGLPCPNIFTGEMAIHSKLEYVSVQDMEKAIDTLVELVQIWQTHPWTQAY